MLFYRKGISQKCNKLAPHQRCGGIIKTTYKYRPDKMITSRFYHKLRCPAHVLSRPSIDCHHPKAFLHDDCSLRNSTASKPTSPDFLPRYLQGFTHGWPIERSR